MVPVADAVVDEDAVVVHLVHAVSADGAVFAAGGLQQPAGATRLPGAEQREVIRVMGHPPRVGDRGHSTRVGSRR